LNKPKIIFMGTPEFAVPSLVSLIEHGHDVMAVVTQPDRARGRGRKVTYSPVKGTALKYGLNVLQPHRASDTEFCQTISEMRPDLLIVIAFGQILNRELLSIPRLGPLNIHPSLLPRYRGPAPIQWTILNDDKLTGLTAIRMDTGLDTGHVILQKEVHVLPDETAGQLHNRLAVMSGDFLLEIIEKLVQGNLHETPQDNSLSSYAPKINTSNCFIKWNQDAWKISAFIRGLDPWPGAITMVKGKRLKLFASTVVDRTFVGIPGRVYDFNNEGLHIETSCGLVSVRELQLPGKKRLAAPDFLRGFPIGKGTVLKNGR